MDARGGGKKAVLTDADEEEGGTDWRDRRSLWKGLKLREGTKCAAEEREGCWKAGAEVEAVGKGATG